MIFILVGAECCFAFLRKNFFLSRFIICFPSSVKNVEKSFNLFYVSAKFENCIKLCNACDCVLIENVDQVWGKLDFLPDRMSPRLKLRLNRESRNNWQLPQFTSKALASWDVINYNRCHLLHLRRSHFEIYCVKCDDEVKINLETTSNIIRERMER